MYRAKEANIKLMYMPPHSSHLLQPLDYGPFSPLANMYKKNLQLATHSGYSRVNRASFITLYEKARLEVFLERNIRAGWKRTGIQPVSYTHLTLPTIYSV